MGLADWREDFDEVIASARDRIVRVVVIKTADDIWCGCRFGVCYRHVEADLDGIVAKHPALAGILR
jgi:hypothetical protein